ncbi:DivIVA domain-containing protein [Nocardia jejuensis]|uniref:DivIVA domain-containing protein n=1 Tax=Nocardia jejuensis TaxID=328049 RepID=UPI000832F6CF|nr:DivIVA domain-containing protein [Nocardia jejuensis]
MDVKPEDLHAVRFKPARLGRRGYDADEVDRFLEPLRGTLTKLARENRQLTLTSNAEELARLQRENIQLFAKCETIELQMKTMAGPGEVSEMQRQLAHANWEISRLQRELERDALGISAQAVNVLNRAQLSADSIVEQAEQHARELMAVARAQHRELLAHKRDTGGESAGYDPDAESQRLAQMRAYTELLRTQLRVLIQTLSVEVDKLALLPMTGEATCAALPGSELPESPYARGLPVNGSGYAAES